MLQDIRLISMRDVLTCSVIFSVTDHCGEFFFIKISLMISDEISVRVPGTERDIFCAKSYITVRRIQKIYSNTFSEGNRCILIRVSPGTICF